MNSKNFFLFLFMMVSFFAMLPVNAGHAQSVIPKGLPTGLSTSEAGQSSAPLGTPTPCVEPSYSPNRSHGVGDCPGYSPGPSYVNAISTTAPWAFIPLSDPNGTNRPANLGEGSGDAINTYFDYSYTDTKYQSSGPLPSYYDVYSMYGGYGYDIDDGPYTITGFSYSIYEKFNACDGFIGGVELQATNQDVVLADLMKAVNPTVGSRDNTCMISLMDDGNGNADGWPTTNNDVIKGRFDTNQWVAFGFTNNGAGTIKWYVNGQLIYTTTNANVFPGTDIEYFDTMYGVALNNALVDEKYTSNAISWQRVLSNAEMLSVQSTPPVGVFPIVLP